MKVHISISEVPASYNEIMDFLKSDHTGAIALFEGVVRSDVLDNGECVTHLFYEAHVPMVHAETSFLVEQMRKHCDVYAIFFHHLLGNVAVGQTSIWLGIAAQHRKEAFEAQTWFLNQFKQRVPIWKKELGDQTQQWVVSHE